MATGRLLNKKIILSRKINSISEGAENLYYRLLVMSDDYGCYHADPKIIKGTIYTLRSVSTISIKNRLQELCAVQLIKTYNANEEIYLQIEQFEKNQKFRADFNRKSEYPKHQQGSRIEPVRTCTSSNDKSSQHNIDININSNKDKNKNLRYKIINYLNRQAEKKFNPDSGNAIKFINGRISRGATWDDFKHVIDVKVSEWKGDKTMDKYLRPETLFNETKFESYRNEKEGTKLFQNNRQQMSNDEFDKIQERAMKSR